MGCCNSKEDHDEDDVHAPLLGNEVHTDSRMNYQTHETIDVKQEQEFWKDVIERTTQNLIDISSSQTDPLQEQDIQERTEKYHDLLQQIPYTVSSKKQRSAHYGKISGMTITNGLAINGSSEAAIHSPATGTTTNTTTTTTATAAAAGAAVDSTTSPQVFDLDPSAIDAILSTAKSSSQALSQEQLQWLDQAVIDVENALSKIEVQPVGDMVIHLTMPNNASY